MARPGTRRRGPRCSPALLERRESSGAPETHHAGTVTPATPPAPAARRRAHRLGSVRPPDGCRPGHRCARREAQEVAPMAGPRSAELRALTELYRTLFRDAPGPLNDTAWFAHGDGGPRWRRLPGAPAPAPGRADARPAGAAGAPGGAPARHPGRPGGGQPAGQPAGRRGQPAQRDQPSRPPGGPGHRGPAPSSWAACRGPSTTSSPPSTACSAAPEPRRRPRRRRPPARPLRGRGRAPSTGGERVEEVRLRRADAAARDRRARPGGQRPAASRARPWARPGSVAAAVLCS